MPPFSAGVWVGDRPGVGQQEVAAFPEAMANEISRLQPVGDSSILGGSLRFRWQMSEGRESLYGKRQLLNNGLQELLPRGVAVLVVPNEENHKYEEFTCLFLGQERKVRAFVRRMTVSEEDMDDVIQQVALVAWRKFSDLKAGEDFGLWACVIARYEVLKWRRKQARDRLVFSEQTLNLLADTELENLERRERERKSLDSCLEKLSDNERALVLSVHTPGLSVARIAEETGQQAKRLYRRVSKLRLALLACVETEVAKEA